MKRILFFLFVFLISVFFTQVAAQQKNNSNYTVAFYNVENLFDTIDNPNIEDDSFTPTSEKEWHTKRYQKKLNDIAKVLSSFQNNTFPEIIGLAEIENARVLEDLAETRYLKNGNYSFVH